MDLYKRIKADNNSPMNYSKTRLISTMIVAIIVFGIPSNSFAGDKEKDVIHLGFKIRAGGRYDNVRMCVASDPGVKGGPAMDISLYVEARFKPTVSVFFDIPVMRPILFAGAFEMLQFEPEMGVLFRKLNDKSVELVAGPTLGISMHYGPDYQSGPDDDQRTESFAAMGPQIGAYVGLDFKRPTRTFNFQLGFHPYVAPLFSINDPDNHNGVVVGGTIDALFRFDT